MGSRSRERTQRGEAATKNGLNGPDTIFAILDDSDGVQCKEHRGKAAPPLCCLRLLRLLAAGVGYFAAYSGLLMDDFFTAGFRYYDGAAELPRLAAGTRLALRPRPTDPYDSL